MPPLSIMLKTVSSDCNLDCDYCYYRESLYGGRGPGSPRHRIASATLERLIPEYMAYVADAGVAAFAWQGGEPTLAGLPLFQRAVELQAQHARPPMTIANSLQTNALLISEAWAEFLRAYDFLVGVSVDGPGEVHDAVRRDLGGRGSFDRTLAGLNRLLRAGVAVNALCVVGQHNVRRAGELLRFFQSVGLTHVQFIPCMDFQATEPGLPPVYRITPGEYGAFLCELFDVWHHDGRPRLSVRTFDNLLQGYLGVPSELCVHAARCDASLIIEHNGDVYPCDFYVDPAWRLGNVLTTPLREIVAGPRWAAFAGQKHPLPPACRECRWLGVCRSGCPRNRAPGPDGSPAPDCFCASYRALLEHADARFRDLHHAVLRRRRYLAALAAAPAGRSRDAGRNAPCPCGSGRKRKLCCEGPAVAQSYLFDPR